MSAMSSSRLCEKPPSAGSKSSRASSGGQRTSSGSQRGGSGGQRGGSAGSKTSNTPQRLPSTGSRPGSHDKCGSGGKSRCSSGSSSRQSSAGSTHSTGRPARPSDKLNPKTIDPFHSSASHSAFATVYNNGGIPCRLVHGSVKHKLAWDQPPQELMFDPLLITLAEGLKESIHPYAFVSRQGFQEILATDVARERTLPVLSKLIAPLRAALSHSDSTVFEGSLQCLLQLSKVTGPALNPHLKNLLSPMSKRVMEKAFKEKVMNILHQLEDNGGREAALAIKAKVPTYMSMS